MQSPKVVLSNLQKQSQKEDYKFRRLYRNLYNPEFYFTAYDNLSKNDGALTMGVDKRSIDGFSIEIIEELIETLKQRTYQPFPSKRVYIPKKNGKKRPLGIPSFADKLVQEVVRMILEAIYEPTFSISSHAYQKGKSCHTALQEIQRTFTGSKWFIEGDIKGFFDNINHHTLIGILRKRIEDEAFIELIWRFLRAGYMEEWKFHNTFSGAPQGGIISPLLSNIYLNELDQYMMDFIQKFNQGKKRKINPDYERKYTQMRKAIRKYKIALENQQMGEAEQHLEQAKALKKELSSIPYSNPMDSNYKRLTYVRYADDFLIGVIGSKYDAKNIKETLTEYLMETLQLELSQEKTLITHASEKYAGFLGYNIRVFRGSGPRKDAIGRVCRYLNGKVQLKMPHEAWVNKLKKYQAIKISADGTWMPKDRGYFLHSEDLEIVAQYNSEIRGLYNYYRLAENVSNHMHRFAYFMYYSMLKTFASKYRVKTKEIRKRYEKNKRFTVTYKTSRGEKQTYFIERSFPREKRSKEANLDLIPDTKYVLSETRLSDRIKAERCELCGKTNTIIHMHHVKRLKDIKNKPSKSFLEQRMVSRNRKTIVLCKECHVKRHKGEV
ncbi:group II intron reverse transcriptase/maturase [Bacillus toyonensis]|uniref:reverse transcriptase domain-containing protein n=1 Tax=Bacillus toyonensis TaxID=155322 RepID=UPI000BF07184|nr:reverse transcriptase domain-containing protein [Bacillus toyonensis]PEK99405.1 group II intron reverse transcriptase/maturase [Bacillus toyonensis]